MESLSLNPREPSALSFILQTCWKLFFPYLSNVEIGRLDSALSDRNLRKLYLDQVSDFYLTNPIYARAELDWIILRNIPLTICRLDFALDLEGILYINLIILLPTYFIIIILNPLHIDEDADLYPQIAESFPDLTEIHGKIIDSEGLSALGDIPNSKLTTIEFENSYLDDIAINDVCKGNPNLINLSLHNQSEVDGPTDTAVRAILRYCPNIQILSLKGWEHITDMSMRYISKLIHLKELNLASCTELTSTGIQHLLKVNHNIEVLLFSSEFAIDPSKCIDTALFTCIGTHCPNLTKLHLAVPTASDVTSASLSAIIRGCPLLEDLNIHGFKHANSLLPTLALFCPSLKHLSVAWLPIADGDLALLAQGCPHLQTLALIGSVGVTDIGLIGMAPYARNLQKLILTGSKVITDTGLCVLFTHCIHITSIELFDMSLITDLSITTLVKYCMHLTFLRMSTLPLLTQQSYISIATYCKYIKTLHFMNTNGVTDECIITITLHCKYIHYIILCFLHNITDKSLYSILNYCQYLNEIRVSACFNAIQPRQGDKDPILAICNARSQRYRGLVHDFFT